MSSARVSFTYAELVRLNDLQRVAWGEHSKAAKKLQAAIDRIDAEATP